ncbi:MAG: glycosyl hydrolase, partial [Haliscomenobacter sp.]
MKKSMAALFLCTWALLARAQPLPFQNPALPVEQRISDLLGRLRTDEKIGLMRYDAKGISRLGIPAYNWWNESLHGVGRAGR